MDIFSIATSLNIPIIFAFLLWRDSLILAGELL